MQDAAEMYEQYAKPVYKYLYSLCHDAHTAEELCAETFYRAVKSINSYNGSCALLTWLCAIAKNVWRQEAARLAKSSALPLDEGLDGAAEASPESGVEQAQDRLALYRVMQALEPLAREVLYLRLSCDLSYREIGEVLGQTETWARVTFYRAKEKLKKGGL